MVFFRGIRNKFIAIYLLFGLIPLLVISYLSFQSASASLERHSTRQLSNLAHKTASQARQRYRFSAVQFRSASGDGEPQTQALSEPE